jgi:hypothetical protein
LQAVGLCVQRLSIARFVSVISLLFGLGSIRDRSIIVATPCLVSESSHRFLTPKLEQPRIRVDSNEDHVRGRRVEEPAQPLESAGKLMVRVGVGGISDVANRPVSKKK